jgi:hypothetical protein
MEVGGLMFYAFKVFLGNPTIMAFLLTFAVVITLALTVIEISRETKL